MRARRNYSVGYKLLYTTVCVITVVKMWTHEAQLNESTTRNLILTTVLTHTVVYKSIYHATPRSICFLPQYQRRRKRFFFVFESVTKITINHFYANVHWREN